MSEADGGFAFEVDDRQRSAAQQYGFARERALHELGRRGFYAGDTDRALAAVRGMLSDLHKHPGTRDVLDPTVGLASYGGILALRQGTAGAHEWLGHLDRLAGALLGWKPDPPKPARLTVGIDVTIHHHVRGDDPIRFHGF